MQKCDKAELANKLSIPVGIITFTDRRKRSPRDILHFTQNEKREWMWYIGYEYVRFD